MGCEFLDKQGLILVWEKIKEYVKNSTEKFALKEDVANISKIYYIDGYSDEDGYIRSEIVPVEAEYDNVIISRMYLHPTLNIWTPIVSYQTITGNNDVLVTGGIRGSAVVLGGSVQAQTFPNCLYRVFYLKIPKLT